MQKIILASASPGRAAILKQTGLIFETEISEVDELAFFSEEISPFDYVKIVSEKKAINVLEKHQSEDVIIIGADTIVLSNGKKHGKPKDAQDAFHMLKELCGNQHQVYTGVTIITKKSNSTQYRSFVDTTTVYMLKSSDQEIQSYIDTGEPLNKAGAYGVQGKGTLFIESIKGDINSVVGLPVAKIFRELKKMDIILTDFGSF